MPYVLQRPKSTSTTTNVRGTRATISHWKSTKRLVSVWRNQSRVTSWFRISAPIICKLWLQLTYTRYKRWVKFVKCWVYSLISQRIHKSDSNYEKLINLSKGTFENCCWENWNLSYIRVRYPKLILDSFYHFSHSLFLADWNHCRRHFEYQQQWQTLHYSATSAKWGGRSVDVANQWFAVGKRLHEGWKRILLPVRM